MDTPKGVQRKGGKKYRKFGRNARPGKHRLGQDCGLRNCRKLLSSRRYLESLKTYVLG